MAAVAYLLDSTVLIDVLRDEGSPAAIFMRALESTPFCSEVTRVEVLRGLRNRRNRESAETLFAGLDWVGIDEGIARRAGEFGSRWDPSHQGMSAADLIVAATADLLGADLVTSNVKHFPMFPDLAPPY